MKKQRKLRGLQRKKMVAGYLFIMPFILGFLAFMVKPFLQSLYMSFCNVEISSTGFHMIFAGMANYISCLLYTSSGPTDISVDEDGIMYICDKENNRILKIDKDLNYLMEFGKPTDATFDQSLSFLPDKLVVDGAGRVYCIADNVNKGIVKYENEDVYKRQV